MFYGFPGFFFFANSIELFVIQNQNADAFTQFASNSSLSGKWYFCLRKNWWTCPW